MPGSRRSSEMARSWIDLCPAVDCSGLTMTIKMMMMMVMVMVMMLVVMMLMMMSNIQRYKKKLTAGYSFDDNLNGHRLKLRIKGTVTKFIERLYLLNSSRYALSR
jgi:hypothetical protein